MLLSFTGMREAYSVNSDNAMVEVSKAWRLSKGGAYGVIRAMIGFRSLKSL